MVQDYSCWHWCNRDTARTPAPPIAKRLDEIRAPTLVITGSRDLEDFQAIGRTLVSGLPNARYAVIEGAGHMVNLEAAQEFNADLREFWEELDRRG